MDEPLISEEHFTRLSRTPRPTRVGWADENLIVKPSSPYSFAQLAEVVVLHALRTQLGAAAGTVVWRQIRDGLAQALERRPCELVCDLHTLAATWVDHDARIAAVARGRHDIRLIDLTGQVDEAREGFQLAAAS